MAEAMPLEMDVEGLWQTIEDAASLWARDPENLDPAVDYLVATIVEGCERKDAIELLRSMRAALIRVAPVPGEAALRWHPGIARIEGLLTSI